MKFGIKIQKKKIFEVYKEYNLVVFFSKLVLIHDKE